MIKSRYLSFKKLMLFVFTAMLPINFLAMVCVGWNDEGAMANGAIVTISRVIVDFFLFPMHTIERVLHIDPFTDTLFFIGDILCLALWAALFVAVFKFIQKKARKSPVKKRG